MNQVIKMTVNRSTTETGLLTAKTENPGLVQDGKPQNKILGKNMKGNFKCCFRS